MYHQVISKDAELARALRPLLVAILIALFPKVSIRFPPFLTSPISSLTEPPPREQRVQGGQMNNRGGMGGGGNFRGNQGMGNNQGRGGGTGGRGGGPMNNMGGGMGGMSGGMPMPTAMNMMNMMMNSGGGMPSFGARGGMIPQGPRGGMMGQGGFGGRGGMVGGGMGECAFPFQPITNEQTD